MDLRPPTQLRPQNANLKYDGERSAKGSAEDAMDLGPPTQLRPQNANLKYDG